MAMGETARIRNVARGLVYLIRAEHDFTRWAEIGDIHAHGRLTPYLPITEEEIRGAISAENRNRTRLEIRRERNSAYFRAPPRKKGETARKHRGATKETSTHKDHNYS